ncbi:MAG: DNA double-strand break repair nuclease NurA [Trueperaceae bacterium]|nr:DNA double-strand break repair nuclease NurA [Trueperaceae bacterium]
MKSASPGASAIPPKIIKLEELDNTDWQPDWVLAIDGSHHEVSIKNGYPGAEASYVTVASVLIDVAKIRELDQQRPIDPKAFRKVEQAEAIDCALPGCNIIYENDISADASLRRALFDILSSTKLDEDSETLLDTYEALLKYKPDNREQECPYKDNCFHKQPFKPSRGRSTCGCLANLPWYSTDALRIHERMNPAGTNGAVFSEVMQVLEVLWLVHILRVFESKNLLSTLRKIAIVLDGPLAVFGQPAWLSQAIFKELQRLNEKVQKATRGKDLLLFGVEKTGVFVDHFEQLDTSEDGAKDKFPREAAVLLSDKYIKKNIIFSESERLYGHATYFGRKLFYKAKSGAKVVLSTPFLADKQKDLNDVGIYQYPRLNDILNALEKLTSTRYTNAVTPLVSAHAEAAIPLHLGNKVLTKIAEEIIKEGS